MNQSILDEMDRIRIARKRLIVLIRESMISQILSVEDLQRAIHAQYERERDSVRFGVEPMSGIESLEMHFGIETHRHRGNPHA